MTWWPADCLTNNMNNSDGCLGGTQAENIHRYGYISIVIMSDHTHDTARIIEVSVFINRNQTRISFIKLCLECME